ncbi:MAG: hypothetical protein KTR31_20575 [Myxococcales bacterium]|nr:hypothetical protein [Myxococcales bacterium]
MTRPDDWLDAFRPEDFDDPELAALDVAVHRLARPKGPQPKARVQGNRSATASRGIPESRATPSSDRAAQGARGAWMLLAGVGLAAALAWMTMASEPPELSRQASTRASPQLQIPDAATPRPLRPEVARGEQSTPGAPVVRAEPLLAPAGGGAAEVASPPRPGLVPGPDAVVHIERGRAELVDGWLTYRHDAEHEPGVSSVAFRDVPVSLHPVGTAFDAISRGGVGGVRVSEGRVAARHVDGDPLSLLAPGAEALFVLDPDAVGGVVALDTTGQPLDQVLTLLPDGCLCRPRDVVALLARLRLAHLSLETP